jgi:glycosyltransferase involved in cell wall biosynthesis
MVIVHLTASTFFGGPERQMLGLAQSLPPDCRSVFLSFGEGGRCQNFLKEAWRQGIEAKELTRDTPHFAAAVREIADQLRHCRADVLCCHGYKADVLGRLAARRRHLPVVAVSRGWTGENAKVSLFEALDRLHLRWMDHVVCVSEGQAIKVRRAGVAASKVTVIHNAIATGRFDNPDPVYRQNLRGYFASPRSHIVGAAGRLSPEKGFGVLLDAAALVAARVPEVGFVVFGDGPLRGELEMRIEATGLARNVVLAGHHHSLDPFMPFLDAFVLPSFTEGLPNVVLEALAASVPVVATAVGGTPEVLEDGKSGFLVCPGDAEALGGRIQFLLASESRRQAMGRFGRQRVGRSFHFALQARRYRQLFARLRRRRRQLVAC